MSRVTASVIPTKTKMKTFFVHFSAIEMDGYRKLTSGQKIEFDIDDGPKGLQAQNIRSINN